MASKFHQRLRRYERAKMKGETPFITVICTNPIEGNLAISLISEMRGGLPFECCIVNTSGNGHGLYQGFVNVTERLKTEVNHYRLEIDPGLITPAMKADLRRQYNSYEGSKTQNFDDQYLTGEDLEAIDESEPMIVMNP